METGAVLRCLEEVVLRPLVLARSTVSRQSSRKRLFIGSAMLLVSSGVTTAQTEYRDSPRTSKWWSKVELVDRSLHNGRWKYARRSAIRLTETILNESWRHRELNEILAELALYRAIADANLEKREGAVWYWHTALNLNRRIDDRDLVPYGPAAVWLKEIPLRKLGEIPSAFQRGDSRSDGSVTPPEFPDIAVPTLLNNSAATRQSSGEFEVEVIVDEEGELHQPVVISRHLNPLVIYASLDWLHGVPRLEPAHEGGTAVVAIERFIIEFQISPYPGGLVIEESEEP